MRIMYLRLVQIVIFVLALRTCSLRHALYSHARCVVHYLFFLWVGVVSVNLFISGDGIKVVLATLCSPVVCCCVFWRSRSSAWVVSCRLSLCTYARLCILRFMHDWGAFAIGVVLDGCMCS